IASSFGSATTSPRGWGAGSTSSTGGRSSARPRRKRRGRSPRTRRRTECPTRVECSSTPTSFCFWTDRMNRRDFLGRAASGIGGLALTHLLGQQGLFGQEPKASFKGGLHHPAKAQRVVHLFMNGGASPLDTFDYKPE